MRTWQFFFLFVSMLKLEAGPWLLPASPNDTKYGPSEMKLGQYEAGYFILPTENNPENATPFLERAPYGVYIGVGTDRIFNLASYSGKTSRIIFADYDRKVVEFNRINAALVRISSNLEEYRDLRLGRKTWTEVESRLSETSMNDVLRASVTMKSYAEFTRRSQDQKFEPLLGDAKISGRIPDHINYTANPEQFSRLKKLADADLIEVYHADLSSEEFVHSLSTALASKNENISVLDLSDTWWGEFLNPIGTKLLVSKLRKNAHNGIVLMTDTFVRTGTPEGIPAEFVYFGFFMRRDVDNFGMIQFLDSGYSASSIMGEIDGIPLVNYPKPQLQPMPPSQTNCINAIRAASP